MKKRHACGLDCMKVIRGRLFHACKVCKHGTVTPISKSQFALGKPLRMTTAQKKCAARYIPEMMRELKLGRWSSRKQAVAVGLAKARARC